MNGDGAYILMIAARFYEDLAGALDTGASAVLEESEFEIRRVAVPGVFEIPAAMNWAADAENAEGNLAGIVTLGCVIRGQTDHYDHICREAIRAIMDLTLSSRIPHGFGVLTCESYEQAQERADVAGRNVGGRAASACVQMIEAQAGLRAAGE